jgi:hypothetical protein
MIWNANGPMSYRSGQYRIYWTTRGWDLWIYGDSCLGRELRLGDAMKLAEADQAHA